MKSPVQISVIIPAYNAARTLPLCLTALKQQTSVVPFEIIVVDDGSTDRTAEIGRAAGVRVICQANHGAASARNCGAQAAEGELLLFTDADCVPEPDWVAQMSAPFQADPKLAGAKGVYRTRQAGLTARFVQLEYEDKYDRLRGADQIDFIDTYSAAYRRDIFLAMGGFDTTFPGASVEDQEFSFRLAEAGYRLIFVPTAKVWHNHDRTAAEYARRKYSIGFWKTLVVRRHPTKLVSDSHTPQVIKVQIGLAALGGLFWLASLLRLNRLAPIIAALAWAGLLVSGWPLYRKIWRQDRAVLPVAPLLLFIRAWALGLGLLGGYIRFALTRQSAADGL